RTFKLEVNRMAEGGGEHHVEEVDGLAVRQLVRNGDDAGRKVAKVRLERRGGGLVGNSKGALLQLRGNGRVGRQIRHRTCPGLVWIEIKGETNRLVIEQSSGRRGV